MTFKAFGVDLDFISQTSVPHNQYQRISWRGVKSNEGGFWTNLGAVPACGHVTFHWGVWVSAGFGAPTLCVKLIRNAVTNTGGQLISGDEVVASIGSVNGQSGTASTTGSWSEACNGADTYNIFVYASANDPNVGCTINGEPAHTWFGGLNFVG